MLCAFVTIQFYILFLDLVYCKIIQFSIHLHGVREQNGMSAKQLYFLQSSKKMPGIFIPRTIRITSSVRTHPATWRISLEIQKAQFKNKQRGKRSICSPLITSAIYLSNITEGARIFYALFLTEICKLDNTDLHGLFFSNRLLYRVNNLLEKFLLSIVLPLTYEVFFQ